MVFDVRELSPFARWFAALDNVAAARVHGYVTRLSFGNFSNSKTLKDGVYEIRIDFGPGYRVYYGREGRKLILLIAGGDKGSQARDILFAKKLWAAYLKVKGE